MAKAEGILALLAPKGMHGGDEEDEEVDAAKDILSAIEDKDAKALSMALSRHYELCAEKHRDEEHDEHDEDDDEYEGH